MTEGQRVVEGMIVKTGLQDATKNVRIYGTISAAASNLLLLLLLPPSPPLPAPTSALDHPPPPCLVLSRLLAKSSSLFLFYFLLPPVFQNARGRSYFSCFSLLLSLLRGVTPPRVFPRLASPSPMSFYVVYSTLPSASIPTPNNLSPLLSIDSPAGVPPTFAAPL